MDPLMIVWVFLIGVITGIIIALSLLYTTAIHPLHKRIERLTQENQSLLSLKEQNKNSNL